MSGNGHCFVEWKEHFVSQERGNRVVHYFLKDSAGESILAVVGTERSVRHMFYVVSEEFLYVHGKESSTNANFKWRSRREVVDWLTSMLSKQHIHADLSESPQHDSSQASGTPEYPMNGVSAPQTHGRLSKNFKGQSPDIVWSGVAWTCGKQLKHFPAFCRDGITIAIKSFVFVMAKGENHYVAYIEDMYEDKRGQRKVKVRWFHHSQEVKGVTPLRNPHPKEVSSHHMCRQFKSNKVKPFDLSKMHGYFDQPILSCLGPNFSAKSEFISDSLIGEEDELGPSEYLKLGSKRTRSGRPCQRFAANHSRARSSTRDSQMMAYRPLQKSNYGSLDRKLFSMKLVDYQPWCTVLQISRKQVKVQYDDLQDEEGCGNLEEWIPAFRLAMPDKLAIRHLGRPMIRPAPPKEQMDLALEVGAAIDAWWSDGWWEGIITGVGSCGDNFEVFFPGESLLLNVHKKDLRISRDCSCTHPFTLSTVAKDVNTDGLALSYIEVPSSTKHVEEEKLNLDASSSYDAPENMDLVNDKKSPSLKHIGTEGVDVNDSCGDAQDVQGNDDDDNKDDNNCEDDKGENNGDDEGREGMEVFETPGQSPKAVEIMEVTS
ncbi:unnamed protein product [Prunus armeniaca]|uniref:Agenet domain-containing protein n=1 Tax=Prunus armeniaca TaxID=36596 RepID=A0A6J5X9B8_PRUAR|nr:unnamed protein product [Prunus armeniaca]